MRGPSLLDVARARPDLSLWLAAVRASGWDELLESGGPWTALAPRDDAFARRAGPGAGGLADAGGLCAVVARHLLPGRWTGRDLARSRALPAADGSRLDVASLHGAIRVGPAIVTRADLPAGNGLLHVLDDVLELSSGRTAA